jgi:hypothetical protein
MIFLSFIGSHTPADPSAGKKAVGHNGTERGLIGYHFAGFAGELAWHPGVGTSGARGINDSGRKPMTLTSVNHRLGYAIGTLALAACLAAPAAMAETIAYKAGLKGADEVPPTQTSGSGNVQATYDTASKLLTYTATYSGLSGPATAAHFHGPADPGKNAGVAVGVQGSVASPIKGTATLTDAQAADLAAGKWYFNVHTEANKGGEIRGQVTK